MPTIEVNGKSYETDEEGYLVNLADWNEDIAKEIAKGENVEMTESHWDGIAAFLQSKEKVSLGFVEGLNNKIRVIQRRAYGLRDEEYLRLKVLTCMLPAI